MAHQAVLPSHGLLASEAQVRFDCPTIQRGVNHQQPSQYHQMTARTASGRWW